MQQAAHTKELFRELDYRESDGIEVSLLWDPATDGLTVFLTDRRFETVLEFAVAADQAIEAFTHPFAYAARAGLFVEAADLAEIAA